MAGWESNLVHRPGLELRGGLKKMSLKPLPACRSRSKTLSPACRHSTRICPKTEPPSGWKRESTGTADLAPRSRNEQARLNWFPEFSEIPELASWRVSLADRVERDRREKMMRETRSCKHVTTGMSFTCSLSLKNDMQSKPKLCSSRRTLGLCPPHTFCCPTSPAANRNSKS